MADQLLIVHGYSDGYVSKESCFRKLQNYLVKNEAYTRGNIHFVEYASMDDQSTYEDFADKLNSDYEKKIGNGNRVDVLSLITKSATLVAAAMDSMRFVTSR